VKFIIVTSIESQYFLVTLISLTYFFLIFAIDTVL